MASLALSDEIFPAKCIMKRLHHRVFWMAAELFSHIESSAYSASHPSPNFCRVPAVDGSTERTTGRRISTGFTKSQGPPSATDTDVRSSGVAFTRSRNSTRPSTRSPSSALFASPCWAARFTTTSQRISESFWTALLEQAQSPHPSRTCFPWRHAFPWTAHHH